MITKDIDNKIVKPRNRLTCYKTSISLLRNHEIMKLLAFTSRIYLIT